MTVIMSSKVLKKSVLFFFRCAAHHKLCDLWWSRLCLLCQDFVDIKFPTINSAAQHKGAAEICWLGEIWSGELLRHFSAGRQRKQSSLGARIITTPGTSSHDVFISHFTFRCQSPLRNGRNISNRLRFLALAAVMFRLTKRSVMMQMKRHQEAVFNELLRADWTLSNTTSVSLTDRQKVCLHRRLLWPLRMCSY